MADVCLAMNTLINNSIYPFAVIAGTATAGIIAISYMASQMWQNPRLSVWAKTEAFQLVVSAAFILITVQLLQLSCTLDANSLTDLVGGNAYPSNINIFNSSAIYLKNVAQFSHTAFANARYYMGKINMGESYSVFKCPIWCFFSQGGSGTNVMPKSGNSYLTSGLMVGYNIALFAYLNALMHLFFLGYIQSGFFLFFLPLAIIVRAIPYMRNVGSLLLSITFGFFAIYPFILSAFSLSITLPAIELQEVSLEQKDSPQSWLSGNSDVADISSAEMIAVFGNASAAFLYSIFVLTIAMLAVAAACAYFAKLMGEEIDLSRLMQMV